MRKKLHDVCILYPATLKWILFWGPFFWRRGVRGKCRLFGSQVSMVFRDHHLVTELWTKSLVSLSDHSALVLCCIFSVVFLWQRYEANLNFHAFLNITFPLWISVAIFFVSPKSGNLGSGAAAVGWSTIETKMAGWRLALLAVEWCHTLDGSEIRLTTWDVFETL